MWSLLPCALWQSHDRGTQPWFRNPGQLFAPNHKGVTTYVADLLVSPHAAVVCGYNSFFIVDGGGTDEKVEVKVAPRRPFTLEGDLATTGASPTGWARSKGPHRATVVTRCRPTGAPDRSLPVRVNVTSPSWPRSVPINIALHYRAMEVSFFFSPVCAIGFALSPSRPPSLTHSLSQRRRAG